MAITVFKNCTSSRAPAGGNCPAVVGTPGTFQAQLPSGSGGFAGARAMAPEGLATRNFSCPARVVRSLIGAWATPLLLLPWRSRTSGSDVRELTPAGTTSRTG